MKVLTATARTQGRRGNDFHWCVEGELVTVGPVCRADQDRPDGGCGCGRSFAGLASHRGTTTAMVRDLPFTRAEYVEAFRASLQAQGYDTAEVESEADELLLAVADIPVGTVFERRLEQIVVRQLVG